MGPGVFADRAHGLLWGAAFSSLLAAACVFDLTQRRIPNWLTLSLGMLGIAFTLGRHPELSGLGVAASGCAVGFALWIVPFVLGMLGAGDVKLFTAAGAWLGAAAALQAAFLAAVVGGLMGIAWWLALRRRDSTRRAMRPTLPYGVPMAVGLAIVAWLGIP